MRGGLLMAISAILIGAGMRGSYAYGNYALRNPEDIKFVAVAEPDRQKRENFAKHHEISDDMCFASWEDIFEKQIRADSILICTQDKMHKEPAIAALNAGYHILLEKPMSPNPRECIEISKLAIEKKKVFMLCHVLRYTPFYLELKKVIDSGVIGKVFLIQQNENVGFWHQAHSFVRGPWSNSIESSPMILAKCCHDTDIMLYLLDKKCKKVSSFGELSFFKKNNCPQGESDRCLDNCPVENGCPYSAKKLYLDNKNESRSWLAQAICNNPENKGEVEAALQNSSYGMCVFLSNNDVVDHQVVTMEFEDGVTGVLIMSAFSKDCTRTIRIMGSQGEIEADLEDNSIKIKQFLTDKEIVLNPEQRADNSGHSGGDGGIMEDFIKSINGNGSYNTSIIDNSLESHMICFAAEESRIEGKTINLQEFIDNFAE